MMKLKLKLSPSFPTLLLVGFALVAMPLLGGILGVNHLLDEMVQQGQQSVSIAAEITLANRQLAESGLALKRAAGQYFVLEDPALKQRLDNAHRSFIDTLGKLRQMPWNNQQQTLLSVLADQEARLFDRLQSAPSTGAKQFENFKSGFDKLSQTQMIIAEQASQVIQGQISVMSKTSDRVQQTMFWQAAAMILLSMILATFLSWLISRPVQQLAEAIRRLGKNDLDTRSTIQGTQDMVYLGDQLDWLRYRLQELEEEKLRFFREVSHELKTPLTNLLEAVALLSDEVVGKLNKQQAEIVDIMCSSADDLQQGIEDLLDYNEALCQTKTHRSLFDIGQLINDVMERFDLSLRAKRLRIIDSVAAIHLTADRDGLAKTIENLISNAVKFSPDGGEVKVTSDVLFNTLRITVCDQGPGVPASEVSQLFQPFFKGTRQPVHNRQTCGKLKSSGLGLAIAKAHIEGQGGKLSLVSTPSWGACFQITLPFKEQESAIHD